MFWEAMWSPSFNSQIPLNKMKPIDANSKNFLVYVARAKLEGNLIPGKFILEKKMCYVSHGGKAICLDEYELLLDDKYAWVESSHCAIHENAVLGGCTENGEKLFIGRAVHDGHLVPGKIHPSHKCLYIPYEGAEHAYQKYEILVKEENDDMPVPVSSKKDKSGNGLTFPSSDEKKHQLWRKSADKLIECQLCEDRMIEAIFIPCGHGACLRCGHGYTNCYKCQEKIQQTQKVCFE